MNKETIKSKAKALRAFLANQGLDLNHSAALEAIAHIEGEASYNVLLAKSNPPKAGISSAQLRTIPLWDIEVCRIGYAHTQIVVKGTKSRKEAEALALEQVDNDSFSEHSSDYVIVGNEPDERSDQAAVGSDEVFSEPRDWEVAVSRISYGTKTLQIEAPTLKDAEELALDEAGNHYYSTNSSSCEVSGAYPRSA